MQTQRVFTISEVNALIPDLSDLVGDQLREQSEIEHGLAELTRLSGSSPASLETHADDQKDVAKLKRDLKQRIERYEAGWARVQTMGGVIKDPQTGVEEEHQDEGERANSVERWLSLRVTVFPHVRRRPSAIDLPPDRSRSVTQQPEHPLEHSGCPHDRTAALEPLGDS